MHANVGERDHTARVIIRGHAFMQNMRRGHYELGCDARRHRRVAPRSPNSPAPSERGKDRNSVLRGQAQLNEPAEAPVR